MSSCTAFFTALLLLGDLGGGRTGPRGGQGFASVDEMRRDAASPTASENVDGILAQKGLMGTGFESRLGPPFQCLLYIPFRF